MAIGPLSGGVLGLSLGGPFGAMAGAVLGCLLGEFAVRTGLFASPHAYLRDPGAFPGGPPFDEPFPGAYALAAFTVSFDPSALLCPSVSEARSGASSFGNLAAARLALEKASSLSPRWRRAFSRLCQVLMEDAAAFDPAVLLRAYFLLEDADPLPAAICAWALCRARWPEASAEINRAMRAYLEAASCPRAAAEEGERILYPDRAEDWELMGLEPGAGMDEIKRRFRSLSRALHPDGKNDAEPGERRESGERFMRIRAAYERLTRRTGA